MINLIIKFQTKWSFTFKVSSRMHTQQMRELYKSVELLKQLNIDCIYQKSVKITVPTLLKLTSNLHYP